MNQDFLEKINSGKFEISGVIKKIIYGNQYTDFYNGIKEIGDTINIIVKATK